MQEFEDSKDAEDAVKNMDGKELVGSKIQVEIATRGRNAQR